MLLTGQWEPATRPLSAQPREARREETAPRDLEFAAFVRITFISFFSSNVLTVR